MLFSKNIYKVKWASCNKYDLSSSRIKNCILQPGAPGEHLRTSIKKVSLRPHPPTME